MPSFSKLLRYGVVGVIGAVVHMSTLFLLVELGLTGPVVATTTGFVFALLISYGMNRIWQRPLPPRATGVWGSLALRGTGRSPRQQDDQKGRHADSRFDDPPANIKLLDSADLCRHPGGHTGLLL